MIESQEEEVSWTTFELAVYIEFLFVTAISISTSETQGKLTQYQNHRKKNNQKILLPVDQPYINGRFVDLEKQYGKVIQWRAGGNNKLLEKGMEIPSSFLSSIYWQA